MAASSSNGLESSHSPNEDDAPASSPDSEATAEEPEESVRVQPPFGPDGKIPFQRTVKPPKYYRGVSWLVFVAGSTRFISHLRQQTDLRSTFPRRPLPEELNSVWVDVPSLGDIPLCWFGISYSVRHFSQYAKELGIVPRNMNPLQTWCYLVDHVRAEWGFHMKLREVWSPGGKTDHYIVAFFSNRQLHTISDEMFLEVEDLLEDVGFEEPEKELFWYLDRREMVSLRVLRTEHSVLIVTCVSSCDDRRLCHFRILFSLLYPQTRHCRLPSWG